MAALTTNTNRLGETGLPLKELADYIQRLLAVNYKIANLLDADAGVSGTSFTSSLEGILSSGAQLVGPDAISTLTA